MLSYIRLCFIISKNVFFYIFFHSVFLAVSLIPCKLRDPHLFDALYINIIVYFELKITKFGQYEVPEVLYAPDTFQNLSEGLLLTGQKDSL